MLRKIKTQEEIARKNKQNQIIIGTVMILLLVFSTLGFSILSRTSDSSSQEIEQNGFKFFQENGRWTTHIADQSFSFAYLPSQTSDVVIEGEPTLNQYSEKPLYLVNPKNEAVGEIITNLGRYTLRYQESCFEGFNCSEDLPTKTCEDNLIIFDETGEKTPSTNKEGVYQDKNCIYLSGDQVKTADAFLYKVLKIN